MMAWPGRSGRDRRRPEQEVLAGVFPSLAPAPPTHPPREMDVTGLPEAERVLKAPGTCAARELWGGGRPAPIWQESHFLAKQGHSFGKETKYILICNGVSGPSPPPPASHTSGVRSEG